MNFLSAPLLAGAYLLLGLVFRLVGRRRRRRAFLVLHPAHRASLRRLGLRRAEDFLGLPAVIVSGHPGRHVARVRLGEGQGAVTAFLKVEQRVGWTVRLGNLLAGFGWSSRSVRELAVLQALERGGLEGPRWLAAGADPAGREFLLVRGDPRGVDLATLLRGLSGPARRREVARRLGEALARFHDAGFVHHDLYAKHVLLDPDTLGVCFLDWQRAFRRYALRPGEPARDLGALHATVPDELAGPAERLALFRAYLRAARIPPGRARQLLARVEAQARRLLARRHVREKRRPPPADGEQAWVCLDGEALCVTEAFRRSARARSLEGLALEAQPVPEGRPVTRRWLPLPEGRRMLLVRRRARPLAELFRAWLAGRPASSPEQRQSALLFRLQRYGVPAPRVLAMGQRPGPGGRLDSFLLTEPPADCVRLLAWLAHSRAGAGERRRVLYQAGALLRRLHEASCYLEGPPGCWPLGVRPGAGGLEVVLDGADGLRLVRGRRAARARRDLARLRRCLRGAGERWEALRAGYSFAEGLCREC
jgi:tRNA A-37 threonylcarbamoyl transferase component Bud32